MGVHSAALGSPSLPRFFTEFILSRAEGFRKTSIKLPLATATTSARPATGLRRLPMRAHLGKSG